MSPPSRPPPTRLRQGFFARRWRGEVAIGLLFWRDMLGVGTALNLLAGFVVLIALSQGLDASLALALHFAPLPYNLFLCMAVWRWPQRTALHGAVALTWMAVMTVV